MDARESRSAPPPATMCTLSVWESPATLCSQGEWSRIRNKNLGCGKEKENKTPLSLPSTLTQHQQPGRPCRPEPGGRAPPPARDDDGHGEDVAGVWRGVVRGRLTTPFLAHFHCAPTPQHSLRQPSPHVRLQPQHRPQRVGQPPHRGQHGGVDEALGCVGGGEREERGGCWLRNDQTLTPPTLSPPTFPLTFVSSSDITPPASAACAARNSASCGAGGRADGAPSCPAPPSPAATARGWCRLLPPACSRLRGGGAVVSGRGADAARGGRRAEWCIGGGGGRASPKARPAACVEYRSSCGGRDHKCARRRDDVFSSFLVCFY